MFKQIFRLHTQSVGGMFSRSKDYLLGKIRQGINMCIYDAEIINFGMHIKGETKQRGSQPRSGGVSGFIVLKHKRTWLKFQRDVI